MTVSLMEDSKHYIPFVLSTSGLSKCASREFDTYMPKQIAKCIILATYLANNVSL